MCRTLRFWCPTSRAAQFSFRLFPVKYSSWSVLKLSSDWLLGGIVSRAFADTFRYFKLERA